MAGLLPSAQPEALPVPTEPLPPSWAFGAQAVGGGLSAVGEGLFAAGMESYHLAVKADAQEKETAFQKQAIALKTEYRNLQNKEAIEKHGTYSAALEKARLDIGNSISSKHGRGLFADNSLRIARLEQEAIDAHFARQNRSYQDLQYKNLQTLDVKAVAAFAADADYNPKAVEAKIEEMRARALEWANVRGVDPDTAEVLATNETHKATDALFRVLLDKNSGRDPALVRAELKKYTEKNMVDPARQKDAVHALGASEAATWVSHTMANFERVDALRNPDPEGAIPFSAVLRAQDELPADAPDRQVKVDLLQREWERHVTAHVRAGEELENTVIAKGREGGGAFAVPRGDLDWQRFSRLYPKRAEALETKAGNRAYQDQRRTNLTAREASRDAYGATRYYLDQLTPEQVRELQPATVDRLMRDNYGGPGTEPAPEEKARAQELLKKLQANKLDPMERQFNSIAAQALSEAYRGDRNKVRAAMNRAHYFLDDTYAQAAKDGKHLSASDLREALVQEFTRKDGLFGTSLFGTRAGENRGRAKVQPAAQQAPSGWYPDGSGGKRFWDGKGWR